MKSQSVTKLAAEWKRLNDDFNSRVVDDKKIDLPQFKRIGTVEAKLVKAAFNTAADLLVGLRILLGGDNPEPRRWCSFKAALYTRMMQYA